MKELNDPADGSLSLLVSVIIPCYKQAHFLAESIDSANSQTHAPVEIVVVDDGSPDNAAEIVQAYPNVRYIRQENSGVSSARNRGLGESRGEYVVFLDADDRLRPNALKLGIEQLQKHPNSAFSYGRCDIIAEDGRFLTTSNQPHVEKDHYQNMLRGNFITTLATIVFRREPLESVGGFNKEAETTEDYELFLRLMRRFACVSHREVVTDYRLHDKGVSRSIERMTESVRRTLQAQLPHVAGNESYQRAWKDGMRNWRRDYYAEMLAARTKGSAREGRWGRVGRDVLWLICFEPRMLLGGFGRKVWLEVKKRQTPRKGAKSQRGGAPN